ncbi:hypothetical protein SanaruYs_39690 [Chryseotalea sanaruensis]|uniref:VCBS repeat-containing protein n=1 Tax=Chryseotalea sanaruensis TaxID=2482724 RepID=A0A401UFP1_9BACT|nr:hypothetical protein [Chryseotalea sanaruensis]GCC53721.1 hypothetical protein SanaruYs_39690 [Chryseotalea sanaruensis]
MKTRTTILILTIATITCWGQTNEQKEKEDRLQFVFDSNLPDDLYDFYNQEKIRTSYKVDQDLNPFYLRGDFDGDKKIDYALAVIESTTDKKGILIYHPVTKKYFLAGAGKAIPNGHGDDYSWMDGWEVSDERTVEQGVTNLKPPKLIGEAILIQKLESSSGLIYWDGKEYRWYQQGD